jgi:hypothetical protein
MRAAFSLDRSDGAARRGCMREGRELVGKSAVTGGTPKDHVERRRPQVEVIREPNEIDESESADPSAAE